ncbi:MAG: hypothetical protein ACFFD2_27580 [Promethearchaeota archaeon]
MKIEIYETEIGVFKVITHPVKGNLVFVLTYLTGDTEEVWEDMGYMKKKEFFKLIKSHNPRKKSDSKIEDSKDTFWKIYASI